MQSISDQALRSTLQAQFGFAAFRPGQHTAVKAVLEQGRVLCVHPTGFGKSLLYQLPAVLLEGITLVISPLLALMRDQEQQLGERFGIAAASLNSDQDDAQNAEVRQRLAAGEIKVLFVAPEQLDHVDRFAQLLQLPVALLVVDEAHCISTWGHDFRPSYRQILRFVRTLAKERPAVRILGLTATANQRTEADIVQQLSVPGQAVQVLRESMSRPNIALGVWRGAGVAAKLVACAQWVQELQGCGLIYCATREHAELVAQYIRTQGIRAAAYHAGFAPEDKRELQQAFVKDTYKVLAATNALGMGIDKSNLRFIIHFDVPGSITAYYQEIGRCGRDGLPAQALLLFDPGDLRIQQHFIDAAQPSAGDFDKVLKAVAQASAPPNITTLKRDTGLHPTRVTVVLAELVEQGQLHKQGGAGGQKYAVTGAAQPADLARYRVQRQVREAELASMRQYAEQDAQCRMELLRRALGDTETAPCGTCSACVPAAARQLAPAQVEAAAVWLARQGAAIAAHRTLDVEAGRALLDGKLRSTLFVELMRQRANGAAATPHGVPAPLWTLLQEHLEALSKAAPLAAVVAVPSRTWRRRADFLQCLQQACGIPVLADLLVWASPPEHRQGELLNNDQRRFNVHQRMTCQAAETARAKIGSGTVILLDDYIGSGHTLKEAARVLRKQLNLPNPIVPVTLAAVKWKLGSAGML